MALVARMTKSNNNPVGMIVPSMLNETQFQAINGTTWILADGRSIAGTRYAAVTGFTLSPDLRGMALRGSNSGGSALGTRADGNQDPDGVRAVGNFQDHQVVSHSHTMNTNNNTAGAGEYVKSNTSASLTGTLSTLATGGNETRMRNVAVNHFIKINP